MSRPDPGSGRMTSSLQRLLGGSPGSVLVRLLFLSLLVGAFMALLDLTPFGLVDRVIRIVRDVFGLGFDALREVGRWIAYGAVIVLPIWFLGRLLGSRR